MKIAAILLVKKILCSGSELVTQKPWLHESCWVYFGIFMTFPIFLSPFLIMLMSQSGHQIFFQEQLNYVLRVTQFKLLLNRNLSYSSSNGIYKSSLAPLRNRAVHSVWVVKQEKEGMLHWQGSAQVLVTGQRGRFSSEVVGGSKCTEQVTGWPWINSAATPYSRRSSVWVPVIAFPASIHANMDAIADPCSRCWSC